MIPSVRRLVRIRLRLIAALVLAALSAAAGASAQTAERDVFVAVVGKSGLPIVGLGPDFFAIREDGRDRDVLRVASAAGSMHIALLVDTSSAIGTSVEPYRNALTAFVSLVSPGNRVALYEFGSNAIQLVPFTGDTALLKDGIARIYSRPDTVPRLVDAIDLACADLKAQYPTRPVIVAVSAGGTDNSARTAGSTIKRLIELPAVLHVVAVTATPGGTMAPSLRSSSGQDIQSRRERILQLEAQGEGDRERTQVLTDGTTKTGGITHRVAGVLAVGSGLDKISAELAASYRVTFGRPATGKIKNLQVGVMMDDVAVRATAAPAPK